MVCVDQCFVCVERHCKVGIYAGVRKTVPSAWKAGCVGHRCLGSIEGPSMAYVLVDRLVARLVVVDLHAKIP